MGNCEKEESETEPNDQLPLGMSEDVQLCHHCAHYPCLCLLLKVEMKIEALREGRKIKGKNYERGDEVGGITAEKIAPNLNCKSTPPTPQSG